MRELLNIPYGLIERQSNIVIFFQPIEHFYYCQSDKKYFQILQYEVDKKRFVELSRINIPRNHCSEKFIPFIIKECVNYFTEFLSLYLNDDVNIKSEELEYYIQRISSVFFTDRFSDSVANKNKIIIKFKFEVVSGQTFYPELFKSIYDKLGKFYHKRKIKIRNHYFEVSGKYINFIIDESRYDWVLKAILITDKELKGRSLLGFRIYEAPYCNYVKNLKSTNKDLYNRISNLVRLDTSISKSMKRKLVGKEDEYRYAMSTINIDSIIESIDEYYANYSSDYDSQYESLKINLENSVLI